MSQAVRTIIFNTKSHLGRNFGILIAWIVLSLITFPLVAFLMRRQEMREEAARALPDEREEEIREEQERIDFGAGTTAKVTPSRERAIEEAEKKDREA
jgi:flagellar biosynthesis/type III secretory pathway M-ring protein FliF/YscJ